jgi:hypothetical protein
VVIQSVLTSIKLHNRGICVRFLMGNRTFSSRYHPDQLQGPPIIQTSSRVRLSSRPAGGSAYHPDQLEGPLIIQTSSRVRLSSGPVRGSAQLLMHKAAGYNLPGVRRPVREADHSPFHTTDLAQNPFLIAHIFHTLGLN